jgi:P pilus assembly chaperone PapD
MEDSRCSSAVADFERGKDKMKWIAVTNPTGTTIHCSGTLIDSNGNTLGGNTVSISSFGQASFTLGNAISQANSSPSSYNLDRQGAPFEAQENSDYTNTVFVPKLSDAHLNRSVILQPVDLKTSKQ